MKRMRKMPTFERIETIEKTIEKHGKRLQTVICMEECAELIEQCILISGLDGDDKPALAEEIADVYICLEMLEMMYELDGGDILTHSALYSDSPRTGEEINFCIWKLSRLIKECSKMLRGKGGEECLEICIADAMECVEVLEEKFGVEVQVNEEIDYKLRRLKKRIEGNGDD